MRGENVLRVHPGGSGYLIAPRLVLTSAHVTGPVESDEVGKVVWVSAPSGRPRYPGTVVWSGRGGSEDDASLVELGPEWTPAEQEAPTRWGCTVTGRPKNECEIRGVAVQVRERKAVYETTHLTGWLNPGDGSIGDYYVVRLDEHPSPRTKPGTSRWQGLSGAAVFSSDLLIGVVAEDPAPSSDARLLVVPVYRLFDQPCFRAVLAKPEHRADVVWPEALEWQDLTDTGARAPAKTDELSPSDLLLARREIVPFRGRDELLGELGAWMDGPGVAWLVHGPGGQGKTRLARQFGIAQIAQRRAVLWLDRNAGDFEVVADASATSLVIVDYAETRQEQLGSLFRALARKGDAKVKVLLLSRIAGEWWEVVRSSTDPITELMREARTTELPLLDRAVEDRRAGYRHAVRAFCRVLPRTAGSTEIDWTALADRLDRAADSRSLPKTALGVDMTALADLLDGARSIAPDGERIAEDRLWEHERRYWRESAAEVGLAGRQSEFEPLADALAAAILVGVATEEEADAVLGALAGLEHLTKYQRRAIRNWIGRLYPPPEGAAWGELQPDRLAEWFTGRHLLTHPEVADDIVPRLTTAQAARLLTMCSRAAGQSGLGDLGSLVAQMCIRRADVLAPIAVEVATGVENPAPLLTGLTRIVTDAKTAPEFLQRLDSVQPRKSRVLAPWAAALSARLVDQCRRSAEHFPDADRSELARQLNNLATRLCDANQYEEAVEPAREAVELLRELADADEDFRHGLADALTTLAETLVKSGMPADAVPVSVESVDLHRSLAGVERADLAEALNGHAAALHESRRSAEALGPAEEAVQIYRDLVGDRNPVHLGRLAGALHTLAAVRLEAHRYEEALEPSAEAVERYRELERTHPDAYRAELAAAWYNRAAVLEVDRLEDAAVALAEALRLYRLLNQPRSPEYSGILTGALADFAGFAADLGWHDKAEAARAEAAELDGPA